jgi:uncharacterized phage-associated protein
LFTEKFQAWKNGPVLRSVFDSMTSEGVKLDTVFTQISPVQEKRVLALLDEVYQEYKDWEIWDVVDKSHEGPWAKTRGNLGKEELSTQEISLDDLVKFANAQK